MRRTSIEANNQAGELKRTHHRKIMEFLTKSTKGTSYEISNGTGLDYHAVARRMKELETSKRVFICSENGKSPRGHRAVIWQLKQQ